MTSTLDAYYDALSSDCKPQMIALRNVIQKNIPKGFEEVINYKMPSWVVPHSIFPEGYHCDPKLPLGFLSIASQKNHIAIYHMGIYASPELLQWFQEEYPKYSTKKLDMGKSCIRLKKTDEIPYELFGKLAKKMSVKQWIDLYQTAFRKK